MSRYKKAMPLILIIASFFIGAFAGISCGDGDDTDIPGDNPTRETDDDDAVTTIACTYHSECGQSGQVCDTGAGRCVECLTNAHCSPGYYCDATHCKEAAECTESGKCDNSVCDTGGDYCVECLVDGDCGENEICRDNTCLNVVPCQSSAECENGVCNTALAICVQCLEDIDCGDGNKCINNYCEPQIACEKDDDCKDSNMVCDVNAALCVVCLSDGNCPDSHFCASDKWCRPDICEQGSSRCDGDNVAVCNANGSAESILSCPDGEACVDGACPGGNPATDDDDDNDTACTPICSARNCGQYGCCGDDGCGGSCGECPDGTICEEGYCLTPRDNCQSDADCTDPLKPSCSWKDTRCYPESHCMIVGCGQNYCNPATGFCEQGKVEEWGTCVQDGDCKGDMVCNIDKHQCRMPCGKDSDCGEGRFCDMEVYYCDDISCTSNEDCTDPAAPICNVYSGKCEPDTPKCLSDEDCKAELTPRCNTEMGRCVQCFTDDECEKENEICDERGLCSFGMDDDDAADDDDTDDDDSTTGPPCEADDGTCEPACPEGQICCEFICYTETAGDDDDIVWDDDDDTGGGTP